VRISRYIEAWLAVNFTIYGGLARCGFHDTYRKAWPGVIAGWDAIPFSNHGDCWLGSHSIRQSWRLLVGKPFHSAITAIAGWEAIPPSNCWLGVNFTIYGGLASCEFHDTWRPS